MLILTDLRDDQIATRTLYLGVSMRVFLEETSILFSRQSEEMSPHQRGQASSNLLGVWMEHKCEGWVSSCSLFELGSSSSPALWHHQSSSFSNVDHRLGVTPMIPLFSGHQNQTELYWIVFLVLQLANITLWYFSDLHNWMSYVL